MLRRLFVELLQAEGEALAEQQQLLQSVLGAVERAGGAQDDSTTATTPDAPSNPALQL